MHAEDVRTNAIYEAAERYVRLGISVIPILPGTKEPPEGFKWGQYAHRIADASERYTWFVERGWQLAVVSGPVSGWLIPLDFDGAGGYASLASTYSLARQLPRVRTGSGKHHVWIRVAEPTRKFVTHAPDGSNLEVRAGTHYTLVPPSIHPSGEPYVWENPPWDGIPTIGLAELGITPQRSNDQDQSGTTFADGEPLTEAEREHIVELVFPHYQPYSRHELCLALAGWLAGHGVPEADARAIVESLAEWGDDMGRLKEYQRGVRDTYRRARQGIAVAGWSRLIASSAPLISPATAKSLDLLLRYRQAEFQGATTNQTDEPPSTEPEPNPYPWIISVTDLLKEPDEPDAWLVDGIWRDGTLGLVVGPPKTYKSFFVQEMAVSISSGLPMFGLFSVPQASPVIYIQEESARRYLRRRFRAILNGHELHPAAVADTLFTVTNQRYRLDDPTHLERLVRDGVEQFKPSLIIFDPFREMHWQDENKAEAMMPILQALKSVRDRYGISIAVVHHNNKNPLATSPGDSIRGSTAIWAAMDAGIFVGTTEDEQQMKVSTVLKEGGQVPPFLYRLNEQAGSITFDVVDVEGARNRGVVTDGTIVGAIERLGWSTIEQIANEVNLSSRSLRPRLAAMIARGQIKTKKVQRSLGAGPPTTMYGSISSTDVDDGGAQ